MPSCSPELPVLTVTLVPAERAELIESASMDGLSLTGVKVRLPSTVVLLTLPEAESAMVTSCGSNSQNPPGPASTRPGRSSAPRLLVSTQPPRSPTPAASVVPA